MFCPKCGAKIEKEDAKFCPKCGVMIELQKAEPAEAKATEVQQSEGKKDVAKKSNSKAEKNSQKQEQNAKPHKSKKKWLIVLLVIVVLGVAVAVGATIMMKKTAAVNKSNQKAAKSSDTEVVDKKIEDETTGETTSDEKKDATDDSDAIIPGSNMADAVLVPLGTKVFGTLKAGENAWFSFTTGETEGATYNVTYVNGTVDSEDGINGYLYDEYGTPLYEDKYDSAMHYVTATADGTPITISSNELEVNTTYYIRLEPRDDKKEIKYTLSVKSPEEKKDEKAALVFEVPFEINETQVQFVINEATFIDEAQAKEAVKPVAEAVLNAPDHAILIAGTTATDGTQESCIDLSNRRAQAVKDLLVNTYKVPESQIKTVGLGYEADPFERGADRDANGNFVESEAKKNRRVVILDVDDPIAQQLLSK